MKSLKVIGAVAASGTWSRSSRSGPRRRRAPSRTAGSSASSSHPVSPASFSLQDYHGLRVGRSPGHPRQRACPATQTIRSRVVDDERHLIPFGRRDLPIDEEVLQLLASPRGRAAGTGRPAGGCAPPAAPRRPSIDNGTPARTSRPESRNASPPRRRGRCSAEMVHPGLGHGDLSRNQTTRMAESGCGLDAAAPRARPPPRATTARRRPLRPMPREVQAAARASRAATMASSASTCSNPTKRPPGHRLERRAERTRRARAGGSRRQSRHVELDARPAVTRDAGPTRVRVSASSHAASSRAMAALRASTRRTPGGELLLEERDAARAGPGCAGCSVSAVGLILAERRPPRSPGTRAARRGGRSRSGRITRPARGWMPARPRGPAPRSRRSRNVSA